nr:MAG TPA: hypothetical protein [Bacteriophage sp.]
MLNPWNRLSDRIVWQYVVAHNQLTRFMYLVSVNTSTCDS